MRFIQLMEIVWFAPFNAIGRVNQMQLLRFAVKSESSFLLLNKYSITVFYIFYFGHYRKI
jgi:hypothetical protein